MVYYLEWGGIPLHDDAVRPLVISKCRCLVYGLRSECWIVANA